MLLHGERREKLRALEKRVRALAFSECCRPEWDSGISGLDQLLPRNATSKGFLIEWLRDDSEAPAESLALQGVRHRLGRQAGLWVVVDDQQTFCPACLTGWGIPPDRLLVIRPRCRADLWWTVEQAFRSPGVAETWCWADRLPDTVLRRWKLALETGGSAGVIFRSPAARRQPSWADVRWRVTSLGGEGNDQGRLVRVELLSCRGTFRTGTVDLEIDDGAGAVRLVPPLADSTAMDRRSVG